MERAEFLGELTKLYSETISVCGTHGKTTTTSMISRAFIDAEKDPSIQVGADMKELGNENFRVGKSSYFILESCEYVRSFLMFHPHAVVLLNIEEDHLDYYKDLDDIKSAFKAFVTSVPSDGVIVLNADDSDCIDVCKDLNVKRVTFSVKNNTADFYAKNINLLENGSYAFDLCFNNKTEHIELGILGYHNVYNALATIALCLHYGIDIKNIKSSLLNFTGASRRCDLVGSINGAKIFDDYAHHPTEIKATIDAILKVKHNKLWVVFQPHTFTRTRALFNEFVTAFEKADTVILTDIYAAREIDTGIVSSEQLSEKINEFSKNCIYIKTLDEVKDYFKNNLKEGDILLTLGAGTITNVGRDLVK